MDLARVKQDECQMETLNSWEGNRVSGERCVAGVMKIRQDRAGQNAPVAVSNEGDGGA